MHRIASLLLLLCFAWTQALAAECPHAAGTDAAGASAPAERAAHAGHGAHTAPVHHAPGHAPRQHDAAPCPMAVGCAVAALPSVADTSGSPEAPTGEPVFGAASPHASPYLGFDPPPPRST